ncbi:MAG: type II secretion system F family protein [Deltaproteobacteria bacterium]|nr:type II secretion system F family protein [Deltaproteobacteria bacterium]
MSLHHRANRKLIDKGVFPFPGAHLVTSLRGWLAGEAVFLATLLITLSYGSSLRNALLSPFLAILLGGAATFLSLREDARKQIDRIRAALPLASFLFSMMLEAGMGSSAAMQESARALPRGPLSREMEEISRSHSLGISRADAIERSRRRIPIDDYRLFLNLILQGERLGIGLSQGLRELSSRMMESQGHRAETLAQKAAVKMLLPLVFFIFPSVFLIILSPVILNLLEMLGR